MVSSERVLVINLSAGAEYQKLLDGPPQTCGMRSGRVYLSPGQACGRHSTKQNEELLVFLTGQGRLEIASEDGFQVGQGAACYIPPNTVHDVKNTGSEPLVYVYCVTPAGGR